MSKIKAAITDGFGNLTNKVQHAAVIGTAIAINKTKEDGPGAVKFVAARAIVGGKNIKAGILQFGKEVMAEVKRQQEESKPQPIGGNRDMLTRQEVLDLYGVCPEDKSYSMVDMEGYPLSGGIPRSR